jgi:hypothetical protein
MLGPIAVLCSGIVIAGYYFAAFDASVATDDGGRIMNFSLMQQQRMGLTIGLVIAGAGFVWVMFEAYRQPAAVPPPVIAQSKPSQPLPWFSLLMVVLCIGTIASVVGLVLEDAARAPRTPRPDSITEAEIHEDAAAANARMIRESRERVEAEKARDWGR